tara:strand:- start:551 stop:835 length:285 start_codon:yes stop_codon:yes gene_type:complete
MSKQKVIPIGKRLLIKLVPIEQETASGIYLPESQQQQKPQGIIVARGKDVTEELSIGDTVEWEHMDTKGFEYEHNGEIHVILFDNAIKVKLENV